MDKPPLPTHAHAHAHVLALAHAHAIYPNAIPLPPKAPQAKDDVAGILYIDKPAQVSAFFLVAYLRRLLGVRTIGHAGTLDPFATGVMVLLIGRRYTRLSDAFLAQEKVYEARLSLGVTTDSYDSEGAVLARDSRIPPRLDVEQAIAQFQGPCMQIPPMFSAKKQQGKKLYELAREGKTVLRPAVEVQLETELIHYGYPTLDFRVRCSKGTYIRTIGHDIGQLLHCGAHLTQLRRLRSGTVDISDCVPLQALTPDTVHTFLAAHTKKGELERH